MTNQHSERDELIAALRQQSEGERKTVQRLMLQAAALLAATPAREWVGLTDAEIDGAIKSSESVGHNYAGWVKDQRRAWGRAIESKLREKNAALLAADKPEQNGYVKVIEVEKYLCRAIGIEWSATGISIASLIDRLAADNVDDVVNDAERLDFLDRYAVIKKPGQNIRSAIDAAMLKDGK